MTSSEELSSVRSTDQGRTWSTDTPAVVSQMTPNGTYDPTTGQYVRAGDSLFDVAVGPDGALYAVWQDSAFSGADQVVFTKSTDGGLTWSTPAKISEAPPSYNDPARQAFTPSVDVSPNGTIAVTCYTFQTEDGSPTRCLPDHRHLFLRLGDRVRGARVT